MEYVEIDYFVAKVIRDLGLDGSKINTIRDWAHEGVGQLKCTKLHVPVFGKFNIKNRLVCLPTGIYTVIGVWYNNKRLHPQGMIEFFGNRASKESINKQVAVWQSLLPYIPERDMSDDAYRSPYIQSIDIAQNKMYDLVNFTNADMFYYRDSTRPNVINFHVDTGEVEILYLDLPKDSKGYYLLPSTPFLDEAIVNWIRYKAIVRGWLKGNEFNQYEMYSRFAGKAISNITMFSPEDAQRILESNSGIIKPNNFNSNFS